MTLDEMRARRINAGLSLADAAERIGVSKRVLMNAEGGASMPHPRNAKKLADFYGVQVTDIWPLQDEVAA